MLGLFFCVYLLGLLFVFCHDERFMPKQTLFETSPCDVITSEIAQFLSQPSYPSHEDNHDIHSTADVMQEFLNLI